jgi:hypothetical protein
MTEKHLSLREIARKLKTTHPEVKRLAAGVYPGPKVAAKLHLVPICPGCKRRMPNPKKQHKARVIVLSDSQVSMKQHINRVIVSEWHDLDVPDIKKVLLSIVKDLKEVA